MTGRVVPRRVLRGAGGHGRGARGSGSRVGNHRVRRSLSAEGGRASRAVTSTCLDLHKLGGGMRVLGVFKNWAEGVCLKRPTFIFMATDKLTRPGGQDCLT